MLSHTLIAALAAAPLAAAHFVELAQPKYEEIKLRARQQSDDSGVPTQCLPPSSLLAATTIINDLPTPASDLADALASVDYTADPCSVATSIMSGSLSKEYSSYSSQIISWASKHEDDLKSESAALVSWEKSVTKDAQCSSLLGPYLSQLDQLTAPASGLGVCTSAGGSSSGSKTSASSGAQETGSSGGAASSSGSSLGSMVTPSFAASGTYGYAFTLFAAGCFAAAIGL